jgi:ornithine decarboxylase
LAASAAPARTGIPSEKIERFLACNAIDPSGIATPYLVVDTDIVAERYDALAAALPIADIFYAVKANPAPELLRLVLDRGGCFDVASPNEIDACLAVGARADQISFGNTIKKRADIQRAYDQGVRLFAFDSEQELDKLSAVAPDATIFCRVLCDGSGADWPLSRKFGCEPSEAARLLLLAADRGFAVGASFHVGSQQRDVNAWDGALEIVGSLARTLADAGHRLDLVNIGGGFPGRYQDEMPPVSAYGDAIDEAIRRHLTPTHGDALPRVLAEPGRYLVADAGVLETEVVLAARKHEFDAKRWVYLDCGKFGGLAETMDEAIRYRLVTPHDGTVSGPVVIAGPTCDSADVLYEKSDYELPLALGEGDRVVFLSTGAYTTTYAAVGFNGFAPLRSIVI